METWLRHGRHALGRSRTMVRVNSITGSGLMLTRSGPVPANETILPPILITADPATDCPMSTIR